MSDTFTIKMKIINFNETMPLQCLISGHLALFWMFLQWHMLLQFTCFIITHTIVMNQQSYHNARKCSRYSKQSIYNACPNSHYLQPIIIIRILLG